MKSQFLFPYKWRIAGFGLLAFAVLLMVINYYTSGNPLGNSTYTANLPTIPISIWIEIIRNDLFYLSVVIGLLFIAFSKEKIEDEQISQLRLDSLQWAIYLNYFIFIVCIVTFSNLAFLTVVAYNTVTPLIFFIIRFRWKIYQLNRLAKEELTV